MEAEKSVHIRRGRAQMRELRANGVQSNGMSAIGYKRVAVFHGLRVCRDLRSSSGCHVSRAKALASRLLASSSSSSRTSLR